MSNAIRFNMTSSEFEDGNDNKKDIFIKALPTILEGDDNIDNTIYLPNDKLNYITNDKLTESQKEQYLVTSTESINASITKTDNTVFTDYFLNYNKGENTITWKGDRVTSSTDGDRGHIEVNTRKVIPVEDFNTNIQMNSTYRSATDGEKDNKHTWVSLHACVSDIGLHQASWNTNDAYYSAHNLTYDTEDSNKILNVRFSQSTMTGVEFDISYLLANGTSGVGTIGLNETKISAEDYNAYYTLKFTAENNDVKIFKLNSVEISKCPSGTTINNGDIEFFFINKLEETQDEDNGITSLEMTLNNTNFDYNCEYLNCQYTNQYYNKNINLIQNRDVLGTTVTFNESSVTLTDGGGPDEDKIKGMYDHIKESYEDEHADLGAYTGGFGNFDLLFSSNKLVLELEGGSGRKASIQINNSSTKAVSTFTISNAGYLYTQYETLRIKDYRLRDLLNFKVVSTGSDTNIRTEYIQDFIKSGQGKSNTIKYALNKTESFVIKSLSISGSVKSDIIIRLIHVKNIFSDIPIQYVLKEFYYYKRTNIQEKHDLNIFISNSGNIGNEIFVDIQKIVKDNNDKSREDTLNFTLNGIKYTA